MMSDIELPLHALRAQIASAIDVVVLVTRFNDGRRGLTQVSEVLPLTADGKYAVQDLFVYALDDSEEGKSGRGKLAWTGTKSSFRDEPKVRILRDQWDLTRKVFSAGQDGKAP
mgnify:FL=1